MARSTRPDMALVQEARASVATGTLPQEDRNEHVHDCAASGQEGAATKGTTSTWFVIRLGAYGGRTMHSEYLCLPATSHHQQGLIGMYGHAHSSLKVGEVCQMVALMVPLQEEDAPSWTVEKNGMDHTTQEFKCQGDSMDPAIQCSDRCMGFLYRRCIWASRTSHFGVIAEPLGLATLENLDFGHFCYKYK
ncbi:hypothetical protein C8R44DRAFT_738031 [Mycena epipterygia]|nr:hypothetical protein C8R44DRAFT_738031 [Mycena epipterygia]